MLIHLSQAIQRAFLKYPLNSRIIIMCVSNKNPTERSLYNCIVTNQSTTNGCIDTIPYKQNTISAPI